MSNGQDNWKNRRRMAWGAYAAGVVFYPALIALAPPENASLLVQIAVPYYTLITAILASYYGWATADHKWTQA